MCAIFLLLLFYIILNILYFLVLQGEDDYMPGSIIEIELHNFMTFNHLKCKPGSRLNLVIGPNGSGKSSIVCAIALGLGGEPQVGQMSINMPDTLPEEIFFLAYFLV